MKEILIKQLVSVLVSMLTPDIIKEALDSALDVVENAVVSSNTGIDDAVVLPLCKAVRSALKIPDNDEVKDNA